MKKLSFRIRLTFGFSILLLFSLFLFLFSRAEINSISADTELIYNHSLIVGNAVRDMEIDIFAINHLVTVFSSTENITQRNMAIRKLRYDEALINHSYEVIKEKFLGDKSRIEETYKTYLKWKTMRDQKIKFIQENKDIKTTRLLKSEETQLLKLLFVKMDRLIDFARNKATSSYDKIQKRRKKSITILWITFISLFFLSILTAIIISRSISVPFFKFIEGVYKVYSKENLLSEIENKSEEEILLYTGEELKSSYQKLNEFNKQLEQKVEDRTMELKRQNEEYAALNEEYKVANEDLLVARHKAEESDQLKTEFIHNMSHEIRTPMNGILGFASILDKDNLSKEKQKQYIKIIQSSGNQLMRVIDDILEIAKLETKQVEIIEKDVCLNDLLMELFSVFDVKAKENKTPLYLERELSDQKSTIFTDEEKLTKILGNLLENALKFTKEGFIEFGYNLIKKNDQAFLKLYVKDTGIGIKPEKQQIIFKRFSQEEKELSKSVGGLGLGLSIAKENVELLGGKITLESVKGKGSTFFISLPYKPIYKEMSTKFQANSINTKRLKNAENIILIVEDEEINYLYLETLIEDIKPNLSTIHAKDGKEAVDICNENPKIKFVLMDLKMPVMNGFEATKKIKKIRPDLQIVAQTAYSTREEKERAFAAGCDDFITKPIREKTLNAIMNKYMGRE